MRVHRVAITSLYQYVLRWDIQRNNVPFRGSIQFPTETHCTSESTTNTIRCCPNLCSLSVTTRTQWSIRIMAIERECESVLFDDVSKERFSDFYHRISTEQDNGEIPQFQRESTFWMSYSNIHYFVGSEGWRLGRPDGYLRYRCMAADHCGWTWCKVVNKVRKWFR